MANRVDSAEVLDIISSTLDASVITALIDVANRLVTDVLGGEGLSSNRLHDIEMYVAAHLVAVTEPEIGQVTKEEIEGAAFLACPSNGCVIHHREKEEMNARGVFIAPGETARPLNKRSKTATIDNVKVIYGSYADHGKIDVREHLIN